MDLIGIGKAISGAVDTVADKFFVDAKDKEAFKLKALELQQQGEFKQQEIQLSAIIAEAQSKDKWTSRARPSFLYIMYILFLSAIPFGILAVLHPESAQGFSAGVSAWLKALPEELYWLFGTGYLGYTGARSLDKSKNKQ